jgi:hypothetical protein
LVTLRKKHNSNKLRHLQENPYLCKQDKDFIQADDALIAMNIFRLFLLCFNFFVNCDQGFLVRVLLSELQI